MVNRRLSREQRDQLIGEARAEERSRPGEGRLTVSRDELLQLLGLPKDIEVTGVAWTRAKGLAIGLRGHQIHWQGGEIVSTNPIVSESQRDGTIESVD